MNITEDELRKTANDLEYNVGCVHSNPKLMLEESFIAGYKYALKKLILQIMPYYGGEMTKEELEDDNIYKYTIEEYDSIPYLDGKYISDTFLSFYTEEQRNSFYENNMQLLKNYFMIEYGKKSR